ncbi:hypothetical protein PR001_g28484 [Phytophthora rubi]|uniref:Reverse transcriptase domain-containing protein n=1 Tax=Phytophthora rubi TaxID=129364 RepID=A0A6A3H9M3_9STRA|nr:hypothetical protein PR001_g28484 [Phytophthora rubi]
MAMVHGAIFNHRTRILMDTGATTSIISLDLARRLKLKLSRGYRLRVVGFGDVPTYATAQAKIKLTLGVRVVYVMDVWVGNIGAGLDCLLGMDFMVAAGVRICAQEGVVRLPDEESLLLVGGPEINHVGLEVDVSLTESVWLQPGRSVTLPVKCYQAKPDKVQEWAGRGDQWVTQFIFVEKGYLPQGERFARPQSQKYKEWTALLYEAEPSAKYLKLAELIAQQAELRAPPAVEKPVYTWPKKLLLAKRSPKKDGAEPDATEPRASAYMVNTLPQERSTGVAAQDNQDEVTQDEKSASLVDLPPADDFPEPSFSPRFEVDSESVGDEAEDISTGRESEPEMVSKGVFGGGTTSREAQKELAEVFKAEPVDFVAEPVSRLRESLARCLRLEIDFTDEAEATVYFHQGTELLNNLRNQLAALPELKDLSPKADLTTADIGEPGVTTKDMEDHVRAILEKHHASFLGDGNAVPAPARGVVCDLDVGDAKPVAQRSRPIRPQHLRKVYELLEKLVQTKLVEYSDWASPIVIVMKKNGVDIRLCIDYRLVNQLIKLMHYPLPLIDDLLIGFESTMWFLSLDMASGFWAVPMTLRAKHISAVICPLGHFQWTRMPFGLKNAPLIYQHMLDNCLWGFVRLPASEEARVDADVLDFLGIQVDSSDEEELSTIAEGMTVFQRNIPAPPQLDPVLGRSSYIDDIAYGAETWEQLCVDLDRLLYRLRYWGISVSLPKSEFGKKTISYLSHEIGAEGIRAKPKIAKGVKDLSFPSTLKGVQSFLGSLNYYNKFIADLPVIAAVLYELTDEQVRAGRDLSRAKEAFEVLKRKIVTTPLPDILTLRSRLSS